MVLRYNTYSKLSSKPNPKLPHPIRAAARNGTISTVAVSAVLEESFPSFLWIAHALDVFITVSVLVSFLAMSIGFKHVLDGIAVDVERVSACFPAHFHCLVPLIIPQRLRQALSATTAASSSSSRSPALIRAATSLREGCSIAVGSCIREAPEAMFEKCVLYAVAFGFVLM